MLDPDVPIAVSTTVLRRGKKISIFTADLAARLRAGSHLILYGPRGAGKSTLLRRLGDRYRQIGVPCGIALQTSRLHDIVEALTAAYPDADIQGLGRRAAATRLRLIADRDSGVLLLDHATLVTTPMLAYLRCLRGGVMGALLAVDVDSPQERDRMRSWHAGALSMRMPLLSSRQLHRCLLAASQVHEFPKIEPRTARYLIGLARGRIGWVNECVRRLQLNEYWSDDRLHLAGLCMDTEIAVRQARAGPSELRRRGSTPWK